MACGECSNCKALEDTKKYFMNKHSNEPVRGSNRDHSILKALDEVKKEHCAAVTQSFQPQMTAFLQRPV